jgi:hypothetical protein
MKDTKAARSGKLMKLFTAMDFSVVFLIGVLYILDGFFVQGSPEQFKMLIGAIGLTATLSALCFRSVSTAREEPRKLAFALAGQRLFRAVILFTFATILRYVYAEAGAFGVGATGTLVIQVLMAIPSIFAYLLGLYLAVTAVSSAHQWLLE